MVYALQNPDDGCPSSIYNAMVVARNKGLIGDETRWDEGITKYEAIKLIVEALKTETGIPQFDFSIDNTADAEQIAGNTADNTAVTTESDIVNGTYEDFEVDETNEEEVITAEVIADQDTVGTETDFDKTDIESLDGTYYATQACNTRKGPSTDYEKIGGLSYSQEVKVTGRSKTTGWYEIEINGEKQYVSDKFLSTSKPQATASSESNTSQSGSTAQPSGGNSGGSSTSDSGYPVTQYATDEDFGGQCMTDLDSLEWIDCF